MKAKIEFNLDDPDDLQSYKRVNQSFEMAHFIFELTSNLKRSLEYSLIESEKDSIETLNFIYEKIYEELENSNVNLERL